MGSITRAFECFIGAWGFINATATNTTTGELIPEWHGPYPSGISIYHRSGYNTFIITANDTTEPERRPRNVSLPAQPGDSVDTWATVAQHSLAVGGPFNILNSTESEGAAYGNGSSTNAGPEGTVSEDVTTSTLLAWVGAELVNEYAFYDGCGVHVLRSNVAEDVLQVVWFYRLANNTQG